MDVYYTEHNVLYLFSFMELVPFMSICVAPVHIIFSLLMKVLNGNRLMNILEVAQLGNFFYEVTRFGTDAVVYLLNPCKIELVLRRIILS